MHLLNIDKDNYIGQADPFILESKGRYYIYTTGHDGVYAYHSDKLFDGWEFAGRVMTMADHKAFWAPSVIELDGKYYMYNSIEIYNDTPDKGGHRGAMFVSESENPLGPFTNTTQLLHPFSIDSHVVKNESGLYIFYSTNRFDGDRIGTYIVVDKMTDPYHVEGNPSTVVVPTLDEDIYRRDRYKKGQHWHTIEGAFYFKEGDWQYVMYSGNCFEQPTYYIGYARAKTNETNLRKIKFEKYPDDNTYFPVLSANDFEEGTGHHSMIKKDGQWYAVYHARDYDDGLNANAFDARNARICKLNVKDGIITAERYKDKI
ncbi:MAG: glycoside hydrolase family 43 protein [Acetobacter sp.]|nr:glycoside hydrolase family 43 protein [Bacteroides sp.]MCM1340880.1 glycoside hydrolase family 43 protein [Acetobacter sp.]MCM1432563.1 glycoside hydrolase family 43 protein [Clostridiales bacterium]